MYTGKRSKKSKKSRSPSGNKGLLPILTRPLEQKHRRFAVLHFIECGSRARSSGMGISSNVLGRAKATRLRGIAARHKR